MTVTAFDVVLGDYTQDVKDYPLSHLPQQATPTGNLHKNLELAVGLRYDVTNNLNVPDSLVNGSSCTLLFTEYLSFQLPGIVWVQFDRSLTGVQLRRKYCQYFHLGIDPN